MRRTKVMTQDRLEKLLRSLPALDEYCSGKGIVEKLKLSPEPLIVPLTMPCTHKAILRDPGSGAYFCADCAIDWAKLHSFRKECMELAVRERRFFIEHPCAECASCAQPPHRRCSFCVTSLCYECMVFIPSKGCACPTCSAWLEAEAQEAEEDVEDDMEGEEFYG